MYKPGIRHNFNAIRQIEAAIILAAAALAVPAAARTPFFSAGQTEWSIRVAEERDPVVTHALQELTNALKRISGADFPVRIGGEAPAGQVVLLGDLADPIIAGRAKDLELAPGDVEQTSVRTIGDTLYLAGNQPRGALYAVYAFLNRELGVRWLWPGDSGEFMPQREKWELPNLAYTHAPGYAYRGFHLCGDWRDHENFRIWMGRNFINIHRHSASAHEKRLGFHSMYSQHNAHLSGKKYFAEHPEYFSEINGQRYATGICMSNPDVLAEVAANLRAHIQSNPQLGILSIFPSDTQDYCRCAACAKTDVSTTWFSFYNRLTDLLKAEYPPLKFATIAYQGYRDVPACEVRNSAFVEYATYMRCNAHTFGDTNCVRNAQVLEAFDAWEKTGAPIGNYGYEFDVFTRNARFTPFFTMIEDAIREGHRRGQAALITEVGLSPRTGPITSVHTVQNRLPIYLYAQLMWDPSRTADELLSGWCRTAYGDAAEAMLAYFRAMDKAWTAMPRHPGILGDAISMVDDFITVPLQERVQRAFDAAEQALAAQTPSEGRERAREAFERERVLYKQWQDLADMKSGGVPLINAPLLDSATKFTDAVSRPVTLAPGKEATSTSVRLAWTREALLLRWRCGEPQPTQMRAASPGRDQGVTDDDAVEVEITTGVSGERALLAVNSAGVQGDTRRSAVGVMEPQWNPVWRSDVKNGVDHWEARMEIPFEALGEVPAAEDSWQIRLRRTDGGRAGGRAALFPGETPAMLFFNSSPATGRRLLYWSGAPSREQSGYNALRQQFLRSGWEVQICSTQETLVAAHPLADAFWLRHPNGQIKVPEDYWQQCLVPAVSNGAVAVFISYWNIPIDRYFGDPRLKLSVTGASEIPLAGRKTLFVAPGSWSTEPHNVARSLEHGYTPAYGFIPADTNAWQVLAIAANGKGAEPYPYLLARRYGRGLIVVGGDSIPVSVPQLLDNLCRWNESF